MSSMLPALWTRGYRQTQFTIPTLARNVKITRATSSNTNILQLRRDASAIAKLPSSSRHPFLAPRIPQAFVAQAASLQTRQFSSSKVCLKKKKKYVKFKVDQDEPHTWHELEVFGVFSVVVFGGACVYYVSHFEKVPETGRWRFMNTDPLKEAELSEEAHAEILAAFEGRILPADHPLVRQVSRVVTNLLNANDLGSLEDHNDVARSRPKVFSAQTSADVSEEDIWDASGPSDDFSGENAKNTRTWRLFVVNDESVVNAMASYGNIIIFTGILPICKDEQGLAAVLGHEIGHAVARHLSEHRSYVIGLDLLAIALQAVLGLDFGSTRLATRFLMELPNSRTQELEADKIGLRLCSRACYDPRATVEFQSRLARLQSKQGGINIDFLQTHPTGEKRVKLLEKLLPEAYSIRSSSPGCDTVQGDYDAFRSSVSDFL